MSLLRKSETKHVVTKTQKVSTPPKYLQSNLSSKGVRSTSYVHRTFVDAEAKVEPDDVRLDITNKKLQVLLKKLKKNTKGDKETLQKRIVQLLGNNFNATILINIPPSSLKYIYKFVSGKTTTESDPISLKQMISLEINGRPTIKIDNFVNQTPPTSTAPTNTTEEETKSTEPTAPVVKKPPAPIAATDLKGVWVDAITRPEDGTEVMIGEVQGTLLRGKGGYNYLVGRDGVKTNVKVQGFLLGKVKVRSDTTPPTSTAPTNTTQNKTKSTEPTAPTAPVVKKPPAPIAATKTTEGDTKKTEQTPEEKEAEALDKKIDEFFAKLINKNKQSDQLSTVMRKLNNRANLNQTEKIIKERLATLNDIITMRSGNSGDYKNGKRIGMIIAQLNGGPTIITYQEIGRALRNKNPKKGSQWSGVPDKDNFKKLREVFSVLPEFKAGFKKFFEAMNTDNDEKVDVNEFATMYLRAKLKKAVFDKTKIDDNFTKKTFDTMLKLFGIGEEGEEEEEEEEEEVETKTSGEFKVGDIVRNISAKGIGVGFTGKITKMKPKSADVTWTNGEKSTNKKLIQLEMVTLKPTIMDRFQTTKDDIVNEEVPVVTPSIPVVTPSKPAKKKSVQPLPTFKVGDIVTSTEKSKKGKGLIGEIDGTTAHVFWEDGSDETNNKLTDLVKVPISTEAEEKIKDIFDFYDTKRKDGNLDNVESLKFLRENLKRISQVFSKKELFSQPDGKSGISFEEFRFMLTVIPDTIAKFEKEVEKEEAKSEPQRKRQPDPDKVKQKQEQEAAAIKIQAALRTRQQKEQARQKQEQARQAALDRQEQARQAALDRQKETEKAVLENQIRNEAEKQQRDADEKKIIVEKKDGEYFVRQTKAYKDYKEKLEGPAGIPETACKPETTTNN